MDNPLHRVKQVFKKHFNSEPVYIGSPGRVNLIGEHTDYNDGFVMPAAIDKMIVLALGKNQSRTVRAFAVDMDQNFEFPLDDLPESPEFHWVRYVKGVVGELEEKGIEIQGFDLVFGGNIPIGSGMSSSAALEGGLVKGLGILMGFDLDKEEMARIGQLTEHNHVGVRCGIMDQFANLNGESGTALKLDCRSLEFEKIPFNRDDIQIVLCNSKVSHNLASSEYNIRREQCEEGVEIIRKTHTQIRNLRDVTHDMLSKHKPMMSEVVYKRCAFVLNENERVHKAAEALKSDDFVTFGSLIFDSHHGLSNEYEVSCPELDILVKLAENQPGVFGSRMMGGGFGGCTINFVEQQYVDDFSTYMLSTYEEKTGITPEIYVTRISDGTHVL